MRMGEEKPTSMDEGNLVKYELNNTNLYSMLFLATSGGATMLVKREAGSKARELPLQMCQLGEQRLRYTSASYGSSTIATGKHGSRFTSWLGGHSTTVKALTREIVVIITKFFPEAMGLPKAANWRASISATFPKRLADQDTEQAPPTTPSS